MTAAARRAVATAQVVGAGVDTWSPAWYVEPESAAAIAMATIATQESSRGSMLVAEPIAGHRVGWFPGTGLVFAEGHPGGDGQLAAVETLRGALRGLERRLRAAGVDVVSTIANKRADGTTRAGRAGVRRLDLTVDVAFDSSDGLAVLEALAALDAARVKRNVFFGQGGDVETVVWRGYGGRRILSRIYDKGVESGTAGRGELVRLEDQRRFQAGRRPDVEQLTPATVHQLFAGRFAPLARAPRITAGTLQALGERVDELRRDGEITDRRAEAMLGSLMLLAMGGDSAVGSRSTVYRRRADLRDFGLMLLRNGGPTAPVDLELAQVFDAALGAGVWDTLRETAAAAA